MKSKSSRLFSWLIQINLCALLIFPLAGQADSTTQLYVRGYVFAAFQEHRAVQQTPIALPHASVFLADATDPSNKPIAENITDLSGHFNLKTDQTAAPGSDKHQIYKLCVKAEGFRDVCAEQRILQSTDVGHVLIYPETSSETNKKTAPVFGAISFHDGQPARGFDPVFGVNAFPTLEMKSASGFLYKTYVNNQGQYIVPNMPVDQDVVLRAAIENETLTRNIKKGSPPNQSRQFTFQFDNSVPKVRLVSAAANGKLLQAAAPGSTVKLRAVAADPNKDPLNYRWLTPDDGGKLIGPANAPEIDWQVPAQEGVYTVRVLVGDGKGGYAGGFINLPVSNSGIGFSGKVVDQRNQPVAGAELEVNGRLTNTDAKGMVKLKVPVQDKYVLTIRQAAYGTASYVYGSGIRGATWVLRPAKVKTADPTQPIVLQHERNQKDCEASRPLSAKMDWTPYLKPGLFDWQDGRGNSLALADVAQRDSAAIDRVTRLLSRTNPQLGKFFYDTAGIKADRSKNPGKTGKTGHGYGVLHHDDEKKARRFTFHFLMDDDDDDGDGKPPYETGPLPCLNGIKVEIPANSLENTLSKKPPTGPVQVAVSMVDLSGPDQMPGDYSAVDSNGKNTAMESYGAGSVTISAGNQSYNLKPNASAKVTIPVDATQLTGKPALPASIPFLYYDESAGVWKQEGTAHLSGSGANAAYIAHAKHFSTMNADVLKVPGERACVAVEVDPTAGFSFPLDIEVNLQPSIPNPTAVQVRTLRINGSGDHSVIYNLEKNKDIALIVPGSLSEGNPLTNPSVPAGVFVVNSGGPQTSASAPPTPNPDGTYYAENASHQATGPCAARVTLKKLAASDKHVIGEFLQGLNFQASNITEFTATNPAIATSIVQGAKDYYLQADPLKKRLTLNAFKQANRFGQPQNPPNEVEFSAVYANGGDLGFGREMHCRRNPPPSGAAVNIPFAGFDYACYVTNYGQPPKFNPDQQDADDAALGPVAGHADATVTMEYSGVECDPAKDPAPCSATVQYPDSSRSVKFYAYDTLSGAQVFQADLDGHGARPLPNLCVVCHGGQSADAAAGGGAKKPAYTNRSDVIGQNSTFLPFDLHYYKFPGGNRAAQEDGLRNINIEIVKAIAAQVPSASAAAIPELINLWYPGNAGPQKDDTSTVVAGWNTGGAGNPNHMDNRLYRDVFARACRTCHVAQPYTGPTFASAASFKAQINAVQSRVCVEKIMPHAQRTNDIFWTSINPNMPGFLEIYGQQAGWPPAINAQCGLFNQDSNSLKSVFEGTVYPILAANCASSNCHGNVGNAAFKIGTVAATYNDLLTKNTNSNGKYIIPNDLANSVLYQKITLYAGAPGTGGKMPRLGQDLQTQDTNGNGKTDADDIRDWITAFHAVGP